MRILSVRRRSCSKSQSTDGSCPKRTADSSGTALSASWPWKTACGPGANEIVLECRFRQSGQVYENLEKSLVFESEKNKLTYDMEIEPIYLVGGFSVDTPGKFHEISQSAVRYTGGFALGAPRTRVTLDRLEQQGFPFFSGELVLEKTFGPVRREPISVSNEAGSMRCGCRSMAGRSR